MNEVHKILYAHLGVRKYALWAFPFEELLIKLKQDRSVGKKMAGPFFGMTAHYATIVLEDKKQSPQTGALTIIVTRHATGIRGELYANLIAFDKQWNLALSDVLEVWRRKAPDKRKIPPAMGGDTTFCFACLLSDASKENKICQELCRVPNPSLEREGVGPDTSRFGRPPLVCIAACANNSLFAEHTEFNLEANLNKRVRHLKASIDQWNKYKLSPSGAPVPRGTAAKVSPVPVVTECPLGHGVFECTRHIPQLMVRGEHVVYINIVETWSKPSSDVPKTAAVAGLINLGASERTINLSAGPGRRCHIDGKVAEQPALGQRERRSTKTPRHEINDCGRVHRVESSETKTETDCLWSNKKLCSKQDVRGSWAGDARRSGRGARGRVAPAGHCLYRTVQSARLDEE
ncbi:hypothetical protein EVAR_99805_1 [Eumeta japonica]|uniref:U7 snRNA-associated Sm-like protein LSm11 n=1 Tax=Eumeta variegata TaxID=151549 RepID=A0A4C1ZEV1_EUMVA|nr:hypothetical protein EVAR_99805_1 [Eumeta japonica]